MKKQFFLSALALTTALMTLDVSLPTFANATAIIQREELAYWIDRAEQAQAPDYAQPWFEPRSQSKPPMVSACAW